MRLHPHTRQRFERIVPALLKWHSANRRSFVWRDISGSPYVVLVREFMLQQTGARQVEKMLPPFLKQFPDIPTLAKASPADILRAWQGLGYNRRALNLLRAAQALAARGSKPFPRTLDELQELPGVGRYTASAILSFAYNIDVPVVDVNIERVLSRAWKPMANFADTESLKNVYELDASILPSGKSSAWHEAVMDLGSTLCTKNNPQCAECPIQKDCQSSKRFLKLERVHLLVRTPSREAQHYGHPQRIWRGRILTIVTESETITPQMLVSKLRKKFHVQEEHFADFIKKLLLTLIKEGFITRDGRGKLSLPSGNE